MLTQIRAICVIRGLFNPFRFGYIIRGFNMKTPKSRLFYPLSVVLLLSSIPSRAKIPAPATVVIEGGTLIDGNGGTPTRDALIIIQGNKITTVSRQRQVAYR